MTVASSRKKSPICNTENSLFFSLVDYRNNYFTSDYPKRIIEFYNGFENRDQLIQWMRERPKGVANIHEVDGDKEIIVVIPTADFNGKYAMECRENIFKGLHMVFVESGEVPDPYFNYAHNCNVGISKAMDYNPKWVVVSNDDMYKIDDIKKLRYQLHSVPNDADVAYAISPEHRFGVRCYLGTPTFFYLFINLFRRRFRLLNKVKKSILPKIEIVSEFYTGVGIVKKIAKLLLIRPIKNSQEFLHISSFGIFSNGFIRDMNGSLYDETYVNNSEDIDLSYRISFKKANIYEIKYKIGDLVSSSLGKGEDQFLRGIAGIVYFCENWEQFLANKPPFVSKVT